MLLRSVTSRAQQTLQDRRQASLDVNTQDGFAKNMQESVDAVMESVRAPADTEGATERLDPATLLDSTMDRVQQALSQRSRESPETAVDVQEPLQRVIDSVRPSVDTTAKPINYGDHPAITSTALAHALWDYILQPGVDSAIDATCGNGHDAVALARRLFPEGTSASGNSELVCVDVLPEACDTTRRRLSEAVPQASVTIHCGSHTPLPLPQSTGSIALVAYNLGFLPQSSKAQLTQVESTMASLADAATVLRVGGLLSVLTYPRSNPDEDESVRALFRGLALYSSRTLDWRDVVGETKQELQEQLRVTLNYIYEQNGGKQTWRVYEHHKIGWEQAPILITAMRIK